MKIEQIAKEFIEEFERGELDYVLGSTEKHKSMQFAKEINVEKQKLFVKLVSEKLGSPCTLPNCPRVYRWYKK